MARNSFDLDCSVARTLEVVGERWSLLVLRDAFYGLHRFDDFQRDLGIARNVLTDRLTKLVEHGVLEKRLYEERPPRHEYHLTEKGRDLLPVLLTMLRWGDRWTTDEPPVRLRHACGHDGVEPTVVCDGCGEALSLGSVRVHPIPVRLPDRAGTAGRGSPDLGDPAA